MMTVSAAQRFMPRPPALVLRRNRKQSGSELNSCICQNTKKVTDITSITYKVLQKVDIATVMINNNVVLLPLSTKNLPHTKRKSQQTTKTTLT